MNSSTPYVLVPMGIHMLELLRYNPLKVVAVLDYRDNGGLQRAKVSEICEEVVAIGQERKVPVLSIYSNQRYYRRLATTLDGLIQLHPDLKFVISSNYTPVHRFIIDHVGPTRVELWEDGLNHYIRLERTLASYRLKAIAKFFAGFYSNGLFDVDYRGDELEVRDRFIAKNLRYPKPTLKDGLAYYIGQPLIEDNLISEGVYRRKLAEYFLGKDVVYLPHPREKARSWIAEIFQVHKPNSSAEEFLIREGANAVYSAFSTVNVNLDCGTNRFLAEYLGMTHIAKRLVEIDMGVELV